MFLCHLKGLVNTFADCYAWHDNYKFAPTIVLVKLIHCFDVCICFADAGFHFDRQIITPLQLFGRLYLICALNFPYVFKDSRIIKPRHNAFIAPTGEVRVIRDRLLTIAPVHHVGRREVRLSGKGINDGFCRVGLEFLMFKL